MKGNFHSVTLDETKCKGCINCMKRCPTEAIRVREGKATIIPERCIDCGECIRICQNTAKKAVCDDIKMIKDFKWKIAMPAPSFYGQFNKLVNINYILTGLKKMGFDDVFEVSKAAEIVTLYTRHIFEEREEMVRKPFISSACAAIVRLISVRFPELCDNVIPIKAPMHVAAKMAKKEAALKTGLPEKHIGVFFISPCPAKVTCAKSPIGTTEHYIDGVLSASQVYLKLIIAMKKIDTIEDLLQSGEMGIHWAQSGGESLGLQNENYLASDGIENVVRILEEASDGMMDDFDFIELNACPGGCVGGVLNIENPYVAGNRLQILRKKLPPFKNSSIDKNDTDVFWNSRLEQRAIYRLDENITAAMNKMKKINDFLESLPGLDCGSCGAPSCRAFAEDVIIGQAEENDCIIRFREQLTGIAGQSAGLSSIIPAPFRQIDSKKKRKPR